MREHILTIILFCATIGITWYVRGEVDKREFNDRISAAESRRTVTETSDSIPSKPRTAEVTNTAPVTPDRQSQSDAVITPLTVEIPPSDTLRTAFAYYTAPWDTTVVFDSSGSVRAQYDPLKRMGIIDLNPPPLRTVTITIVDSIFVKTPEEREWWRTPAYIVVSIAAGYLTNDILKQ